MINVYLLLDCNYSAGLSTARQFFGSVQKPCGYVKSDQVLNNVHAIWVAEIKEDKVNLWHIHPDTKENRNKFGI